MQQTDKLHDDESKILCGHRDASLSTIIRQSSFPWPALSKMPFDIIKTQEGQKERNVVGEHLNFKTLKIKFIQTIDSRRYRLANKSSSYNETAPSYLSKLANGEKYRIWTMFWKQKITFTG